jgi:polyribonucleotide nucleotidyltransferase
VKVKVIERDERGRLRLSMKALIPKPGADGAAAEPAYSDATGTPAAGGESSGTSEERPRREGGDRGDRGGRGGSRGGRGGRGR